MPPTTRDLPPRPLAQPLTLGGLRSYKLLIALALVLFIADQGTKFWVEQTIPLGTYHPGHGPADPITVLSGSFYLVHIINYGAAWGMFSGFTHILGLLGFVAIAAIFFFRRHLELHRLPVQITFGLIIGGILGNVIDRFYRGGVVDFLDVHLPALDFLSFPGYRWPAFNIADSAISTGVILYLLWSFFFANPPPPKSPETPPQP